MPWGRRRIVSRADRPEDGRHHRRQPATLIKLGSLHEPGPLLAAVCFLLIAILSYKRVFGAILISIIGVTLAGWGLGLVKFGG